MKKITIVKSKSFICNFCLRRDCKFEVKSDTYGSTMFCLCETCAKKLNECLTEMLSDMESKTRR